MTKVDTTKNDLIVRDVPISKWLMGAFGIVATAVLMYFFRFAKFSVDNAIDYLFVLTPAGFGIYYILRTGVTTTIIHKLTRHITVTKRGIIRNNYDKLPFNQVIARAYVMEIPGKGTRYSLRLPIAGDKHIELAADRMYGSRKLYDIADQINDYLRPEHGSRDFEPTILPDDHLF